MRPKRPKSQKRFTLSTLSTLSTNQKLWIGAALAALLLLVIWTQRRCLVRRLRQSRRSRLIAETVRRTNRNYGQQIDRLAARFRLPAPYLKALIALECNGRKPVPPRFEPHVYARLASLRSGRIPRYENLRPAHLKNASNAALKNLARSWGPFQIMGYKCISLGIEVKDLRGENALYWGVVWIDRAYGHRLRRKEFKHAFHIHNTGRPHPTQGRPHTHHPDYVQRGLHYMARFQ